jgi:hypothetical protein
MALLYKRRVFAFALETTPGTAVSLTGDTCFCFDPVVQAEIPMHDRVATGSMSQLTAVPGARKGKITFSVELAGGGTSVPPAWAPLLTCCGMSASSNVYSFTSNTANYHTATIGLYEDGRFKTLAGCMGTWSLEAEYGKPVMVKFEFSGVWVAPIDTALPSLPSYSVIPPRFASATFTVASFTPKISKLSLEAGNTVALIEDITQVAAYSRAIVTNRNVKGKLDPLGELVGTYDCYGQWIAGTTAALSLVVGSVSDNTITIAAPYVQIANVQEAQRNDLVTEDQDFICTSASTGDGELTITFS